MAAIASSGAASPILKVCPFQAIVLPRPLGWAAAENVLVATAPVSFVVRAGLAGGEVHLRRLCNLIDRQYSDVGAAGNL
jgi:hypothetical protein